MGKSSKEHHSDEFGQLTSHGVKGLDAPMIGAPSSITLDALVERESGVTPPPPPVSVKALVIFFIVMFVIGVVLLFVLTQFAAPPPGP
jgi:hypothetical protein